MATAGSTSASAAFAISPSAIPPPGWRAGLRRALLRWYRTNARDLPWRRDPEPYRVWLSEIMLQQTQMDAVLPYFARFIERFPTISSLASAPEEDVLTVWQGLGYYRRARQLQEAARLVVARHGGAFPTIIEEALALPGVGRYTAGAILSIAYDRPLPVVDGNVARVLARLLAEGRAPQSAPVQARFWAVASALVPRRDPGAWNQALMELGALVCTPRGPDCPACPVAHLCAAHAQGLVDSIPPPRARRLPPFVEVASAWCEKPSGSLAVVQRPDQGVLGGFWELPQADVPIGVDPRDELAAVLAAFGAMRIKLGDELGQVEHGMFNQRARLTAYAARMSWEKDAPVRFMTRDELLQRPLTTSSRKLIRAVELATSACARGVRRSPRP